MPRKILELQRRTDREREGRPKGEGEGKGEGERVMETCNSFIKI